MAEIKSCPFCGKLPVRVSHGTMSCDGMVDGREVHNTISMRPECWNARANTRPNPRSDVVEGAEYERIREIVWAETGCSDEVAENAADAIMEYFAAIAAMGTIASSMPAYRTRDASGSPEAAEVVAWNWISELAQAQRKEDAALLVIQSTPVEGGGKVTRLYRSTTLLAVATTFRDDMNFTVLVRWVAPETTTAISAITSQPVDEENGG